VAGLITRVETKVSILNKPSRYPGLYWTAKYIGPYIPKSKIYVECFAGLARTAKYSKSEIIILNDKSKVSNIYCKKKFTKAIVENMDFIDTLKKYDSKNTFFLIDPPWRISYYNGNKEMRSTHGKGMPHRNMKAQDGGWIDRTARQYIIKIKEILPKLKGNWILTLGPTFHSHFKQYFTTSVTTLQPKLFGYYPKTWLFSNKPLKIQVPQITDF